MKFLPLPPALESYGDGHACVPAPPACLSQSFLYFKFARFVQAQRSRCPVRLSTLHRGKPDRCRRALVFHQKFRFSLPTMSKALHSHSRSVMEVSVCVFCVSSTGPHGQHIAAQILHARGPLVECALVRRRFMCQRRAPLTSASSLRAQEHRPALRLPSHSISNISRRDHAFT